MIIIQKRLLKEAKYCLNNFAAIEDSGELVTKLNFLKEQIKLIYCAKSNRRYSPELIVSTFRIYASSSSSYENLLKQDILTLPSKRTLQRVLKKLDRAYEENNDKYFLL